MMSCYIQILEKHKEGWHIRFGGPSDEFWTMLSNFKAEQKLSHQAKCYYNPKFFNGRGGWFCTDGVLEKYAWSFTNYAEMRAKAIDDYQQNGKAEADRRQKEAEEKRERQWEETQERYRREQRNNNPPPSTSLQLIEALTELGLSPLTPLAKLDEKQVKAAFRTKALKAHPDTGGSHQAFIRLNKAYQLVLFQVQKVGAR